MPLPAMLTFNELTGEECRQVLENRFTDIMAQVPCFQRHLTLPRVRMTLNVKLEVWADQPQPEAINLSNTLTVVFEGEPPPTYTIEAESVDSSAPGRGGHPPDQIRDMHGLPIPAPALGPRNIGAHIQTSDTYMELEGREVQGMPGLTISRTGSGEIGGMSGPHGATIAKIDQGPAGLRQGQMNRDAWRFGGPK